MREYRGFIADSRRWDGFPFREGDIVISAPSKCGTTWMQRLISLLVFDGPDLPAPLGDVSPWLDMHTRPLQDVLARLEEQEHRRFIKTHVPLDGLRLDQRVTYVVVGRDPRDAWVSMQHHAQNLDIEVTTQVMVDAVGDQDLADLPKIDWPDDPREAFGFSLDLERGTSHTGAHLASVVHHLATGWQRRALPNVHLFHYADLQADLVGEVVRLAEALGIDADRHKVSELAQHARLDAMRSESGRMAPEASLGVWRDPSKFFRSGGSGEWRELLTPETQAHYADRVAELTGGDAEFADWIHHGRRVAG